MVVIDRIKIRRLKNLVLDILLILIFLYAICAISLIVIWAKQNIAPAEVIIVEPYYEPSVAETPIQQRSYAFTSLKPMSTGTSPAEINDAYHNYYSEDDVTLLAKLIWVEARGEDTTAKKAAVVWCVLNRLDSGQWGNSIYEVVSEPHQFANYKDCPATEEYLDLAKDVLNRWVDEKNGGSDVGRVLPSDYYFFGGTTGTNRFRKVYDKDAEKWDWSLPSPYDE